MLLLAILFFTSLPASHGLKILAVLPFPMKSHQIVFNTLLSELVQRGHDVTVYSSIPLQTNASNYKHIHVSSSLENKLEEKYSFENMKSKADLDAFIRPLGFQLLTGSLSEEILNLPQVKDLLESDEKFNVVILETFFGQEALIGFGHRFSAPVVSLSSFGSFSLIDTVMGNPTPLSYFTTYQLPYTSNLTFYKRIKNLIATMSELYYCYFTHLPRQQAVLRKHFHNNKNSQLPLLIDLLSNIAVVLLNSQPEVSYARPWIPNMITVGGLHIPTKTKSLPQAIQKFVDEAEDGFIYFSFGSTFSGATIPSYIKEAFVAAFRQIPQRVIWKIDIPPADLPDNVLAVKWAPQTDILADSKCRAFITHGGLLSLLEAVHFAVPIIGVPVFADQPWNIVKAEDAQIGVRLRLLQVSAESVLWAINEVLDNTKYKRNIDQLSAQMRDRLVSPLDTAVYWVDYVAKHQGAPQLRSPARKMPLFQSLMIDVEIFLLVVITSILIIFCFLFTKICKLSNILFSKYNIANKKKN